MIGLHLSQYVIDAEIGRGGMGIVYRATDTKLNRTVALKVLPRHALASDEDRARFFREAQAAAQLSHPHVCHIYQVDEAVPQVPGEAPQPGAEKRPFIAMEFIEGEGLDARIAKSPLKLTEAVTIATQVAEALKSAHEKEIVHRDIKSANVMLTSDGVAKVLDFGLAQTAASTKLTRQGSTLGTVAYMSPEQAQGETVDNRTDLWSLGVVLYEMIAGRLPFAADYEQAALYAIVNQDPEPLTAIRTGVPMRLEWISGKLLAKRVADRYQRADDLMVDLRTVELGASTSIRSQNSASAARSSPPGSEAMAATAVAPLNRANIRLALGLILGALAMGAIWMVTPSANELPTAPTLRLSYPLGGSAAPTNLAISRDGSHLAYVSDRVYVANLTTGEEWALAGTENTTIAEFSPSGDQLLLTKTLSVERIPVGGGPALTIVQSTEGSPRAAWGPGDWILYEDEQQIFRYSESRGERWQISQRDSLAGEYDLDWPRLLPDGRTVMATVETTDRPPRVRFMDFETGDIRATVNFAAYGVRWLESGHLVGTVGDEGLVVVPFDLDRFEMTGPRRSVAPAPNAALFSVSNRGTLIYTDIDPLGNADVAWSIPQTLTFPGLGERLPIPAGYYSDFRLSPDESIVAFIRHGGTGTGARMRSLWLLSFESGDLRELVGTSLVHYPAWTPDGDSVVFYHSESIGQPPVVHVQAADGTGNARSLFSMRSAARFIDIAPDRSYMVYVADAGPGLGLLRRRDLQSGVTMTIAGGDGGTGISDPRISPDGRWVAYRENEDVVIGAAYGSGVPVNMSRGFARNPRWARDGNALLLTSFGGAVFRGALNTRPSLSRDGTPLQVAAIGVVPYFEAFKDGDRAIVADAIRVTTPGDSTSTTGFPIRIVVNWFQTLSD